MTEPFPPFVYDEDPEAPGWMRWQLAEEGRFNAFLEPLRVRREGDIAIVRMDPRRQHSNLRDHVHGGALLGFIDVALFGGARAFGALTAGGASTLDLSVQFIAGGAIGTPLEAHVELLRETGRLIFLRGLVVQGDVTVASFSGTIRKSSQ